MRTRSWTSPPRGKRAPRVGISSTLFGVRGVRGGGADRRPEFASGTSLYCRPCPQRGVQTSLLLSLSRSLPLSLPHSLPLSSLLFSPSLLQNSVVVVQNWSVQRQLGPTVSNEGYWVPAKSQNRERCPQRHESRVECLKAKVEPLSN